MRASNWRKRNARATEAMRRDIAALRHDLQLSVSAWMRAEDARAAAQQANAGVDAMRASLQRMQGHQIAMVDAIQAVTHAHLALAHQIEESTRTQQALADAVGRLASTLAELAPDRVALHDVPTILGGTLEPTVDLAGAERDERHTSNELASAHHTSNELASAHQASNELASAPEYRTDAWPI